MRTFTDSYLNWVKTNTVETHLSNGWTEIATPFMDRHNDGLVIFAKEDRGEVTLSDDGYIIRDMELYDMSAGRRMKAIQNFFRGYGVTVTDDKELQIKTTMQSYPVKQHLLLQAMMSASDMFVPSTQKKGMIFLDEVVHFFEKNDIFYTPDAQFQGKSGYIHKVDFIIQKGKRTLSASSTPSTPLEKAMSPLYSLCGRIFKKIVPSKTRCLPCSMMKRTLRRMPSKLSPITRRPPCTGRNGMTTSLI